MDSEVTFSNPSFQKNLWSLRNDFTDSTIICDGGTNRLGCHKIVLASVSQVLREKLKDSDEIDLGDVSNEDANLLIKFIYVGKIKVKIRKRKFTLCTIHIQNKQFKLAKTIFNHFI